MELFFLILIVLGQLIFIGITSVLLISDILSLKYGAPFVPMKKKLVRQLLAMGNLNASDVFYDLGCGDGRVLLIAIHDFGVIRAYGYEAAPFPYIRARMKINANGLTQQISIQRENFLKNSSPDATFIYTYLFPEIMDKLASKWAKELRPGTKILSASFPINLQKHPEFSLIKSEKFDNITGYLYQRV